MSSTTSQKTLRLVTSAILVALATVLSLIKISPPMLYGGSVTLFGMVPVMILGCMYGPKWGLLCGTVFGVLQAVLGATTSQAFAGVEGFSIILMTLLDYLLAFAVLGLSGVFQKNGRRTVLGCTLGGMFAGLLRFVCHFLSGVLLWGSYAEWFFTDVMTGDTGAYVLSHFSGTGLAVVYSAVYNGLYMVPEIIISGIGIAVLLSIPQLKKHILNPEASL